MMGTGEAGTLRRSLKCVSGLTLLALLLVMRFAAQDHLRLSVLAAFLLHDRTIIPQSEAAADISLNGSRDRSMACQTALVLVNSMETEKRSLSASEQRLSRFVSVACEADISIIQRFTADLASGYSPTAFDVQYLSEILERQDQLSEATALRRTMPEISLRYVELGRIAIEQLHDEARGLVYFNLASQIAPDFDPQKADLYRHLCLISLRMGSDVALRDPCVDFDRAIPSPLSRLLLGQRYYSQGEYQRAVVALSDAAMSDPARGDIYYWIGRSWIGLGQLSIAEDSFLQGIDHEPNYPWNYMELAQLKLKQGCANQAQTYLDQMKLTQNEAAIVAANKMLQEIKQSQGAQQPCR